MRTAPILALVGSIERESKIGRSLPNGSRFPPRQGFSSPARSLKSPPASVLVNDVDNKLGRFFIYLRALFSLPVPPVAAWSYGVLSACELLPLLLFIFITFIYHPNDRARFRRLYTFRFPRMPRSLLSLPFLAQSLTLACDRCSLGWVGLGFNCWWLQIFRPSIYELYV